MTDLDLIAARERGPEAPVAVAAAVEPDSPPRSLWSDVWRQFRKHRGALVGIGVLAAIVFIVLVGPYVYTISPDRLNPRFANRGMGFGHPLGTDNLGRDMLAQIMAGGRVSLAVGISAMLIAITLGSTVGVLAGYFRRLDGILMRMTDLFLALPILPLLLVIILLFRDTLRATFGPSLGIFLLIVTVIGITSWMRTARVVRAETLAIKEREFVLAARSIGTRSHRIIFRHIVPNVLSPIMVSATLGVAEAIIVESALSFLGLGFPPDFPTWGRLLYDGANFMTINPERVIWPGLAISLTVLSVNFIGEGLRDALDPRLRS
jgi:peptide/nickel transport system permease protein